MKQLLKEGLTLPKRANYLQQPIVLESIAVDSKDRQYIAQIIASTFLDETKPVIKFYQVISDKDINDPWTKKIGDYYVMGTPASYYLDTFMGYDNLKSFSSGKSDIVTIDGGSNWYITGINKFRDEIRKLEKYGLVPKQINEGLMLPYKNKNRDRYFDTRTDVEFNERDIDEHDNWYKVEYDNNGNDIYREWSDGDWDRFVYDQEQRLVYYEDDTKYWEKYNYNQDGSLRYTETSRGNIIDGQINEGLMLSKKDLSTPEKWFKNLLNQMDTYDKSQQYPNSIFFHINGKIYMEYEKDTEVLWCSSNNIRLALATKFGIGDFEVEDLVADMVAEQYRLKIFSLAFCNWHNNINDIKDEAINEGLMLGHKKFPDRYFDYYTNIDFPKNEINEHPLWGKEEYDKNGNRIYKETYTGFWVKSEYDENGKRIYAENSRGYWIKYEYDNNGNEIYKEDSDGNIEDNRDQIQEGLTLPKLPAANITCNVNISTIYDMSDTEPEYTLQQSTEYTCDSDFRRFIEEEMLKLQQIFLEQEKIKLENIKIKYCSLNDIDNAEAVINFNLIFATYRLNEEPSWETTVRRKLEKLQLKYNVSFGYLKITNIQPI